MQAGSRSIWHDWVPHSSAVYVQFLVRLCAASTLVSAAPALLQQMRMPTPKGLLLCMASSAFSFYLFAYQVHEKSILLPLMPLTLLAPDLPGLSAWLPAMAALSMFPLLKKDCLVCAYLGCLMLWASLAWPSGRVTTASLSKGKGSGQSGQCSGQRALMLVSCSIALALNATAAMAAPPERLPYLFDALISAFCFLHFFGAAVYVQLLQWRRPWTV